MKTAQKYTGLEIAIVGMACRFPGAANWRSYWSNLVNGVESVEFLTDEQLFDLGVDAKLINNKSFVKARIILKDKDLFDHSFFNYSPSEALLLNPAHKIFHECVWEALEDAGCNPEKVNGPVGLFAGAGDDFYWKMYAVLENANEGIDAYTLETIDSKDYLATLIAYKLNLKGPAFVVNTACSTSLVAVNMACKSLLFGETKIALAGGISLTTRAQAGYMHQEGMIFSADGHCKAFDKNSSGTVPGEGGGVVVLKRLTDAIADRDHIYAVIKGSALSNDGSRKVGFTAPSVEGQVECYRKSQVFAQVQPETITYVEAHGTGTALGDPIELESLNIAFNRNKEHKCAIGSAKTNIGHLDTAAGVAGLIKTALALKYKLIPPSLHFTGPNPKIDFTDGPFYVNTSLLEWKRTGDLPLRAAVTSLGIGGNNVHAILEQAPEVKAQPASVGAQLLTLSANTTASIERYLEKLKNFLTEEPEINIADMAYTYQTGRKHFAYRLPIVCNELSELLNRTDLSREIIKSKEIGNNVVFMFTGQGSQYANMCSDLYISQPYFREEMDKGFAIIKKLTGEDFSKILFPENGDTETINETRYTQPVLFVIEYALARLLMFLNIMPKYMIGHSIGEYVAACISGVFSYEDALKIVARRGELMNSVPRGAMLSMPVTEKEALQYADENISLAAVNGPEQVVLSGDMISIDALKLRLDEAGTPYLVLHTSHAFHSAMQEDIMPEFKKAFEGIQLSQPKIPFLSNLTGNFILDEQASSPDYWVQHLRNTVRFSAGINILLAQNFEMIFIEVGAGKSLTTLLKQHLDEMDLSRQYFNLVRGAKAQENDTHYFLDAIGRLWAHGVTINWENYHNANERRKVSLPTYSFEPNHFLAEVDPVKHKIVSDLQKASTVNYDLKNCIYHPFWKRSALQSTIAAPGKKGYLIFSFSAGFSGALRQRLEANDSQVTEVFIAEEYKKLSGEQYSLDPTRAGHFAQLLADMQKDGALITDIVYTWTIAVDNQINLSYLSIVKLVQSLLKDGATKCKKISIVTASLHRITGIETGAHGQSLALGLVNVLPQEYSFACCNIDVDLAEPLDQLVDKLANEINNGDSTKDRLVAFRNGHRWLQDFQQELRPIKNVKTLIRKRGVYLITGGLGNLGFLLAKYLIQTYDATVVLTGRRPIKERTNGVELHSHEALDRLNVLKTLSKDVTYFTLDIADAEKLRQVVQTVESSLGPINGIIHAAGVLDPAYFELLEDVTEERSLAMFHPKVKGIEALYDVFSNATPDFIWVSSSLATVLGGLGYGAYSAANLYMEHFIHSHPLAHAQWKCVALGEMIFNDSTTSGDVLFPAEITRLFEWSLSSDATVVVETKRPLSERLHEVYEVRKESYLDNNSPQEKRSRRERPNLSTEFEEPATETERKLKIMFENFLGVENIGVKDNFFELGGDSLKGMMLLKRIRKEFSINMVLADFFKRQTIKDISFFIDEIISIAKGSRRASKIII